MSEGWGYFLFGLITWPFLRFFAHAINQEIIEYRQRRFLKLANLKFPDNYEISFVTIDTSDRRAMAKLERELRDQYDLSEEDGYEDSGFDEILRRHPPGDELK